MVDESFPGGTRRGTFVFDSLLRKYFFSDVSHNKFLNNRGAACKLESPLKC